MKNPFKIGFGLAALLLSATGLAATWSAPVGVKEVEVDPVGSTDTSTYLSFVSTPTGKPSCMKSSQGIMTPIAGVSPEHIKAMTALATSALLYGRNVRVMWAGNCYSVNGVDSYGVISGLLLQ